MRIVVPFAAGGPADVYARFLAQRLPDQLGQPFVVENRPGAGAVIGTDLVAKAPPDGYTLLLMSNTHTVNETLVPNKPYNLTRDFVASRRSTTRTWCWWRTRRCPRNIQQVLKAAKARPGKLNYASSGPARPTTWPASCSRACRGVYLVHIPTGAARARAPT